MWNGAMFGDLDEPLSASRGFVSISCCSYRRRRGSRCPALWVGLPLCYLSIDSDDVVASPAGVSAPRDLSTNTAATL